MIGGDILPRPACALEMSSGHQSSGGSVSQKKPRRRAFAPKVRTGCLTCRIRRKKCDEEKPVCKRCVAAGVKCDGYAPVPTKSSGAGALKKSKPSTQPANQHEVIRSTLMPLGQHDSTSSGSSRDSSTSPQPLLDYQARMPSPSGIYLLDTTTDPILLASDPSSRVFFHHFRTHVLTDLIRLVDANDFWVAEVLPLCYTEPAVLHAITALGAAHTSFLSQQKTSNHISNSVLPASVLHNHQSNHEQAAAQHYNYAIRQILDNLESRGTQDVERLGKLLICCIIFYCLECLQGRPEEAVKHLRSGAGLLGSIALSEYQLIGPGFYDMNALPSTLRSAARALDRLGTDASFLKGETVIPSIAPFSEPAASVVDSHVPFGTFSEAKDAMWDLDMRMHRLDMEDCPDSCGSEDCDEEGECPSLAVMLEDPRWRSLLRDFRSWSSRFGQAFGRCIFPGEPPSPALRERLLLTVRQRLWDIFFVKDESHLPLIYEATLCTVEHIYEIEDAMNHQPVFTLDSDTIPLLALIGTESEMLAPKVVRLLRQYPRRECLWDSLVVASQIEAAPPGSLKNMDWKAFWMPT
ncbi:hypothetical protein CC79DRAFT_1333857 [Sarocladium strictum]